MLSSYRPLALAMALCGVPLGAVAEIDSSVSGTWALERGIPENAYVLAARGALGSYLICFDAGNVSRVTVAVGGERSVLARGSCTLFAPTPENGIVVNFEEGAARAGAGVALGTFRMIVEDADNADDAD